MGGADTVFPFSSAEYPDTLVIFSSAFNDLGGFNYVMNFLGNVYSYAWLTKTGSNYIYATINGTNISNGKTRFTPNRGANTLVIHASEVLNVGCTAKVTLSKS